MTLDELKNKANAMYVSLGGSMPDLMDRTIEQSYRLGQQDALGKAGKKVRSALLMTTGAIQTASEAREAERVRVFNRGVEEALKAIHGLRASLSDK